MYQLTGSKIVDTCDKSRTGLPVSLALLLPWSDARKAGYFFLDAMKCDRRQRDARLAHLSGRHLV